MGIFDFLKGKKKDKQKEELTFEVLLSYNNCNPNDYKCLLMKDMIVGKRGIILFKDRAILRYRNGSILSWLEVESGRIIKIVLCDDNQFNDKNLAENFSAPVSLIFENQKKNITKIVEEIQLRIKNQGDLYQNKFLNKLKEEEQLVEIRKDINKQVWNKRMPSDKLAITNPIVKEKFPEWIVSSSPYPTQGSKISWFGKKATKGEEVSNRFNGEIYKLSAEEYTMYNVLGNLNYLIESNQSDLCDLKNFSNGLDWFSRNNKEAYKGLCGVNQEVDLPIGYNMIGLDVVYDGNMALGNIREKYPLNKPLLFLDSKDALHTISIQTENKEQAEKIIDEIKQKTTNVNGCQFKELDTNNIEEWDYMFNYRDLFYIGYIIKKSVVRINMLRSFNSVSGVTNKSNKQPSPIAITSSVNSTSSVGFSDGSISIIVSGGTAPYSFIWTGPNGYYATTQDIKNLTAGHYHLYMVDDNGCSELFNNVVVTEGQKHLSTLTEVQLDLLDVINNRIQSDWKNKIAGKSMDEVALYHYETYIANEERVPKKDRKEVADSRVTSFLSIKTYIEESGTDEQKFSFDATITASLMLSSTYIDFNDSKSSLKFFLMYNSLISGGMPYYYTIKSELLKELFDRIKLNESNPHNVPKELIQDDTKTEESTKKGGNVNPKLLPLIETFKKPKPSPKLDQSSDSFFEDSINQVNNYDTYESRLGSGNKLPPSLTDTLICDICTLNASDDDFETSQITIQNIKYAFDKYLNISSDKIAGYRPRVHSNFIKQFHPDELELLANEILQYIHLNGVRDTDD
jgi:hypothetical protein